METTEKIIECYVRYVLRWATIPNIKCDGQYEIDLIAIDPVNFERYHIESGVSASNRGIERKAWIASATNRADGDYRGEVDMDGET